jgi:Ca2+-binding RTX toxin-like protein
MLAQAEASRPQAGASSHPRARKDKLMATLTGQDNADWLIGTNGADLIKGFGGNDTLKGGGGADALYGGVGIDTALYVDSTEGVFVDLMYGYGSYGTAQGDTYYSIENVWGSAHRDVIHGDNNPNTLTGLDGDDRLSGHGGADVLEGGYGHDELIGGPGADTIFGGPGVDTASYDTSPWGVTASLGSYGYGGDAQGDRLYDVENLRGSYSDDTLHGDGGANTLMGEPGADHLYGFGGGDNLRGGAGNDTIYGHDGNDWMFGDGGDDTLHPGLDTDNLYGGAGADRFMWGSAWEAGLTVETFDVIWDFNRQDGDLIGFSGIDANEMIAGNQEFSFIGRGAFTAPGQIRYEDWRGDTYIYVNTDGDLDFEGGIRVEGLHTVNASWFYL